MSVLYRRLSFAAVLAPLFVLGACDPRFIHKSDMSPREIVNLSGTWSGRGSLSFSNAQYCPRTYLWRMHVGGGNVDGQVVEEETPNAPPATFSTFVDYDGSVHADLRTKGRDFTVLGTFSHRGFEGTARSPVCSYTVFLRRDGPTS